MAASLSDALTRAQQRTARSLFPIRAEQWIHLGFIAFLADLASAPAAPNLSYLTSSPPGPSGIDLRESLRVLAQIWSEHATRVTIVGGLMVASSLALGVLALWLGSRGQLMFTESVIHDRHAVVEPWRRLREPAWQLFRVRLVVAASIVALTLFAAGVGVVIAWPDLVALRFGGSALAGLLVAAGLTLLVLPLRLSLALIDDFLVPIVYLDGVGVRQAWRVFRTELLPGRVGVVALFYVVKVVLGFAIGLVAFLAACLTCCLAALPYVSHVVLLPIHVFLRAFSLYFLEQLGKPVFPREPPPEAWRAAYEFPSAPG
jgi:hypothetical protein